MMPAEQENYYRLNKNILAETPYKAFLSMRKLERVQVFSSKPVFLL
jgi:hypothetical protein